MPSKLTGFTRSADGAPSARLRWPSKRGLIFPSLRTYQRSWVIADALAALSLLAIAIPEQLATSRLAGMPPVTGYYAFIAGTIVFAFFGANPKMSVGADSTIAPLFAVGVARLAPVGTSRYVELVGLLAVLVGVLVSLVGVLRLGWIADFLSAPIIVGFLAGVAIIIVAHQLPDLLGLPQPTGSTLSRLAQVGHHLDRTNFWALGIGLGSLALILGAERLEQRIPAALFCLFGSTALVAVLHLRAHGVAVLGSFSHRAPQLGLRNLSWSSIEHLSPIAVVVALVVLSQTAATSRAFGGGKTGDSPDVGRDFVGVGAGNVIAGLLGAFPVDASPPRTALVSLAGGKSQVAGLGAATALAALIPASDLLSDVPLAALAAVLVFVAGRIFRWRELLRVARFDVFEFALALLTLVTVPLVGVEQGIGVAVALAVLDRARRAARPKLHVLGRIPGTTSWTPLGSVDGAAGVPNVLVVLFATPLWYANADHFRREVLSALAAAEPSPKALVLDAIGMSDIDYTGAAALEEVLDELEDRGVVIAVARAGSVLKEGLVRAGLLNRIGAHRLFASVNEAVVAISPI